MLTSAYQRLDDTRKIQLAEVFANRELLNLVNMVYTEVQVGLLNLDDEHGDEKKFLLEYNREKQRLRDIADFLEFLELGRKEFQELMEQTSPNQSGEQQETAQALG